MYNTLLDILREASIFERADLQHLNLEHEGMSRYLSSAKYPWVRDMFHIVKDSFEEKMNRFKAGPAPRIVSERVFRVFGGVVPAEDPIFEARGFYSCLFPNRVWFESHQFVRWEDSNTCMIPPDFLASLLSLRPLLISDLALLLPIRFKEYEGAGDLYAREVLGTYHYRVNNQSLVYIPYEGKGGAALSEAIDEQGWAAADVSLFSIPRLRGARLDDYVEIVRSHPDEFELYCSALNDFIGASTTSESVVREWVDKLHTGTARLNVLFNAKKRELRMKGLEVTTGLFCTAACLFLPAEIKTQVAALFGAKSAIEGLTWLANYRSASEVLSSDPFWIVWSLQR